VLSGIYLKPLLGVLLGAAIGVVYARFARCSTGTCPLTSNVWTAGLFGAAIGLMLTINLSGAQAPGDDKNNGAADRPAASPPAAPAAAHTEQKQGEVSVAKHIESEADFESQVLRSSKPVLVDFYATWCAPCRMLEPIMDQLAGELAGRAQIVKVDVDKVGSLAERYRIMGVPTVMVFDQGRPVQTFVGVRSKAEYLAAVNQAVPR
jgi:thioredoxin 1